MATQHMHQSTSPHVLPAPTRQRPVQKLDLLMQKFGDFILAHWAMLIAAALGLLVLLALSVPFLSYFGLDSISKPIFYALHYVCAQIPSHSFYIYGHQLGLCARNLSIYTAMFLGSLIFALSKKRLPGIPWWLWLLLILPMAWDGITQMFGLRESDWILRVITGSLFGLANVWFALPLMQKSIQNATPTAQPHHIAYQRSIVPVQQLNATPPSSNRRSRFSALRPLQRVPKRSSQQRVSRPYQNTHQHLN